MNQTALGFFAHPDDAEILCAGTLIRLREKGWKVHIATATAGDCGTMDKSPWEISAIRVREAQASAGLIEAKYHCLDEKDGLVVYDKPTLRKAIDLFRRVAPGVVFTHPPEDYMGDHEQVSRIARAVAFVYSAPNISKLPRNPEGGIPHLYFCDPIEGIDHHGKVVRPEVLVDISAEMELKEKMLASHASQREWLRAHHGMDEYIESMKRIGAIRGEAIGAKYAEGFVQYRPHSFPQDDLLVSLLGGVRV